MASGTVIKKGKFLEVSDSDARILVAYKQCEYADKADGEKTKGLSTKNGPVATGMK